MKSETLDELKNIFCEYFDDNKLIITGKTNANDIEDWDSIAQVGLILSIEKRFSIQFSSGEVEVLQNVGEMANLINEKR
jgi:acyl carrier protein